MNVRSNPWTALALGVAVPLVAAPHAIAQSAPAGARPAAIAAAAAEPAFTQRDAHVHGRVTVNLALEGGTLSAALESPAINVVGFERAPRNAAERSTIAAVDRWLASGADILGVPPAARCRRTAVDYTAPQPGGSHAGDAADHEHDHEHETAQAGDGKSEDHADYEARYTYTCANPAALAWVELWLARRLRNVAEIEVNLVTPQGQSQLTVAGDAPRIALK